MGWPRVAGRGGPATRARTYYDVYFNLSSTMFMYRLHKLVWQRNALALIFRQRNALALNLVSGYPKSTTPNKYLKSTKWWQDNDTGTEIPRANWPRGLTAATREGEPMPPGTVATKDAQEE